MWLIIKRRYIVLVSIVATVCAMGCSGNGSRMYTSRFSDLSLEERRIEINRMLANKNTQHVLRRMIARREPGIIEAVGVGTTSNVLCGLLNLVPGLELGYKGNKRLRTLLDEMGRSGNAQDVAGVGWLISECARAKDDISDTVVLDVLVCNLLFFPGEPEEYRGIRYACLVEIRRLTGGPVVDWGLSSNKDEDKRCAHAVIAWYKKVTSRDGASIRYIHPLNVNETTLRGWRHQDDEEESGDEPRKKN